MPTVRTLRVEQFGPIREAEVRPGDLTVLVGPQATGKSLFLQLLRLILDKSYVQKQMHDYGYEWGEEINTFLDLYFGEGMHSVWRVGESHVWKDNKPVDMQQLVSTRGRPSRGAAQPPSTRNRLRGSRMFYIPAQRVLSLSDGWPRPFHSFSEGDPFSIRDFSETFRRLLSMEFSRAETEVVFPQENRLKREYRDLISRHIYGGFQLSLDRHGSQKRLVLQKSDQPAIPYMAWSAGQREFTPLLMGLYWLIPPAGASRREPIHWVTIEEPEMGLHPRALRVVLVLLLELLRRGYKVCVSTHSSDLLSLVWAIQKLKKYRADPRRLLEILVQPGSSSSTLKELAEAVVEKSYKVYFFAPNGECRDISDLSINNFESEETWGDLETFADQMNELVAEIVNQSR